MSRLLVVSNRLPFCVQHNGSHPRVVPSSGGLATALVPVLRRYRGCWIGWSGTSPSTADPLAAMAADRAAYRHDTPIVPLSLTADEQRLYYDGCCNEVIWPLFHGLTGQCNFDPEYPRAYEAVNAKFAAAVEQEAASDDLVWVHDYHLMMVAEAMLERGLRLNASYFHHIPFPCPDLFARLPWRRKLLRALLAFQSLGFQTERDRANFAAGVRVLLPSAAVRSVGNGLVVEGDGRATTAYVHPISIEFEQFAAHGAGPKITKAVSSLRAESGGVRLLLGVDRLDYTKGIPERLRAFEALLARHTRFRRHIALLQVVVPSREDVPGYQRLLAEIEQLVSAINGKYATPGWTPVRYLHRTLSRDELVTLYRGSDVLLVTSLIDGMNLVAKEYCASRVDDDGAVVLSEFAGAANELAEALLVNPFDRQQICEAIVAALEMSPEEQRWRMQRMRRHLRQHDVFAWVLASWATLTQPKTRPVPEAPPVVSPPAVALSA